jgi:uncharacterized protein (DUF2249 family)
MHKQIQSPTARVDEFTSDEHRVLHLGRLSNEERARAMEAFEYLSPGHSLEIVTKKPAGRLITELQVLYGTGFYWWPLERGPFIWRATLAKPAPHKSTVAAVMGADHLRLYRLWGELERAAQLCQIDRVHRRSAELSLGLWRYIDIEEAVLFPLLEAQTQMSVASTTQRMRKDHNEIGRMVDQLDRLRTATDCPTSLEMLDRPVQAMNLFQQHCRREEATLYSLMGTIINPAEERELISLLQQFEV